MLGAVARDQAQLRPSTPGHGSTRHAGARRHSGGGSLSSLAHGQCPSTCRGQGPAPSETHQPATAVLSHRVWVTLPKSTLEPAAKPCGPLKAELKSCFQLMSQESLCKLWPCPTCARSNAFCPQPSTHTSMPSSPTHPTPQQQCVLLGGNETAV